METTLPGEFGGPPLHRHPSTIDSFYVLDGTLTVTLGDRVGEAGPGTYALAPAGSAHTFSNRGREPVRMLNLMVPGGFDGYFEEAAAAIRPGEAPDPAVLAQIMSGYDYEPVAQRAASTPRTALSARDA